MFFVYNTNIYKKLLVKIQNKQITNDLKKHPPK